MEANPENDLNSIKEEILANYNKPSHALSYASIARIYNYYKGGISKKDIESTLAQIDTYSLTKQERRSRHFNKTLTFHARDLVQVHDHTMTSHTHVKIHFSGGPVFH